MSLQERARNTRSHSLKPLGQPSLLTQRSKRTLSLPSKPVIPPLINIQRYHDNWESYSEDDEPIYETYEESMGKWLPFREGKSEWWINVPVLLKKKSCQPHLSNFQNVAIFYQFDWHLQQPIEKSFLFRSTDQTYNIFAPIGG